MDTPNVTGQWRQVGGPSLRGDVGGVSPTGRYFPRCVGNKALRQRMVRGVGVGGSGGCGVSRSVRGREAFGVRGQSRFAEAAAAKREATGRLARSLTRGSVQV